MLSLTTVITVTGRPSRIDAGLGVDGDDAVALAGGLRPLRGRVATAFSSTGRLVGGEIVLAARAASRWSCRSSAPALGLAGAAASGGFRLCLRSHGVMFLPPHAFAAIVADAHAFGDACTTLVRRKLKRPDEAEMTIYGKTHDGARPAAGQRSQRGHEGLFRQMPWRSSASCQRAARLCLRREEAARLHRHVQRPDAGRFRPDQARARDDRGRRLVGQPLLLLPDRAWRGGAAAVGRSGARRDDGDELPRRRPVADGRRRCSTSPSS